MLYRTKPRYAKAKRLTENTLTECRYFINPKADTALSDEHKTQIIKHGLSMKTKQQTFVAEIGDYIIKAEDGQCFPCKPELFETLYEQVLDDGLHLVH